MRSRCIAVATLVTLVTTVVAGAAIVAVTPATGGTGATLTLPYADSGLDARQAAVHLLDRFAFGPRPGDVDRVVDMGLERWLEEQLSAVVDDPELEQRLAAMPELQMSLDEIARTFQRPARVARQAVADGVLAQSDLTRLGEPEVRRKLRDYMEQHGYRPTRELDRALVSQKLVRAVSADNQLIEVLVDFWFNHFNVSTTDNQARTAVLPYERDAIRPYVLGRFRDLLGATARHPAMLLYLDNAQSTAPLGTRTTARVRLEEASRDGGRRGRTATKLLERADDRIAEEIRRQHNMETGEAAARARRRGINENYARELLELHTLGVDGGYGQADVVAVARALTGWTIVPREEGARALIERAERGRARGLDTGVFVDGDFLFRADAHDAEEKVVLRHRLPAGGDHREGEWVLDLLASHPSTARTIARKMAMRFVGEDPPPVLVERLASVFIETDGDLARVVVAIVESPEFWSEAAVRARIKSPLVLVVSAVRALDGEVSRGRGLVRWLERLGQPLYACVPPTGYPDRATAWVNAGALINRMSFGLELALGRIDGVRFDRGRLAGEREPESLRSALEQVATRLMPERDVGRTVEALLPVARDPGFAGRLESAARASEADDGTAMDAGERASAQSERGTPDSGTPVGGTPKRVMGDTRVLAEVVGIVLGSPEFQRH